MDAVSDCTFGLCGTLSSCLRGQWAVGCLGVQLGPSLFYAPTRRSETNDDVHDTAIVSGEIGLEKKTNGGVANTRIAINKVYKRFNLTFFSRLRSISYRLVTDEFFRFVMQLGGLFLAPSHQSDTLLKPGNLNGAE
jgi:hypothetical protein